MRLLIEIPKEEYQIIKTVNGIDLPSNSTLDEIIYGAISNGTPLSENNPIIQYEGKTYIADKLTMKTKDKNGYYSFYGFKEMEE